MSQPGFTITVDGSVTVPQSDSAASLAALPQVTATVGGAVFTGVAVYSLVAAAGLDHAPGKNGQLQDTVQVIGGDGGVVLSEGEIDPSFGGAAQAPFLATTQNGTALATPQLIVPGDANTARDIAGVTTLTVGEAAVPPLTETATPTTYVTVEGAVADAGTYTVASIEQAEHGGSLSSVTQYDTFFAGSSPETFAFTGPSLFDLLQWVGLSPAAQANLLDDDVVVTGSDGYTVVYSMGEIENHSGPVALLAIDDGTGTYPSISGNGGDFRSTAPFDLKGGRYDSNVASIAVEVVGCFRAGTMIATRDGATAVERLQVGQRVVTRGGTRPIVWLGHRRLDPSRHPRPQAVLPVRIQTHAMAPGVPSRDLFLSPDHAIYWDGLLIPVRHLLNGTSIAQTTRLEPVDYWHVELDRHDVVLADGMAAESFLPTDESRQGFTGGRVVDLHPYAAERIWEADACAPLAVTGADVERLRAWLARRAAARAQRPVAETDQTSGRHRAGFQAGGW